MRQALIYKGSVKTAAVPAPTVGKGRLLIRVVNSCISAGTEMAGVASTGKSPVRTMLEQPEKIRKLIGLIKSEGLHKLLNQYKFLKESGQPTGYSVSGVVIGIGEGVADFKIGDAVAASGGGFAFHAEFVEVPKNLVVKIPNGVEFKEASTVALGAIALHGVRRTGLNIGEYAVVVGTGILGLIAIQILHSSGIQVIAVDINVPRLKIAADLGAQFTVNSSIEDPVKAVDNITQGHGSDAVLFAASTSDSKVLSQSFQMCRRKGKVVLMGVSGMDLNRKDLYPGEIDLHISTSYGPGRYDDKYEEQGIDYPYAYVRWTEGRNFAEYLRLLASKQVNLNALISRIYPIEEADKAFDSLKDTENKPLIVLLDYGKLSGDYFSVMYPERKIILRSTPSVHHEKINVGIIGVGNFAQLVHLPNLKKLSDKYSIYALASQSGVKAKNTGVFYSAHYVTTDYNVIINDPKVDLIMICTRHRNHAELTLKALKAGKHVFVEKPLATTLDDLARLEDFFNAHQNDTPVLMVGFNRRFSPYFNEIRKYTAKRIGPLYIHYRMNAGYKAADHWTHSDGGRIVGECCHIIDAVSSLTGSKILQSQAYTIEEGKSKFLSGDNKSINLSFEDGSIAVIEYLSLGSQLLPKEYMEVHFDEKTFVLNDYKSLKSYGFKTKNLHTKSSEKGHLEELNALYNSLNGHSSSWPIEWSDLHQTTAILLQI
jgi:predicted dehydrogenase/threonine dehydrogenase-like Zn-dependent dehydrogenase